MIACSNRRPKGATGHGPRSVEVACSCFRIKNRTGFIIGKIGKSLFRLFIFRQYSCRRITRKSRREPLDSVTSARPNTGRPLRIRFLQHHKPMPQPSGVKLVDRKWANAALRATRTANKPLPCTPRSIGQSSIHDLDQILVAGGQHSRHKHQVLSRESTRISANKRQRKRNVSDSCSFA